MMRLFRGFAYLQRFARPDLLILLFTAACGSSLTTSLEATITALPDQQAADEPPSAVEVPENVIEIDGVAYRAYQTPGDPFRFLCQEPCKVDANLIYAQYAGFSAAHDIMISVTGVEPVLDLLPIDFHLTNDSLCGTLEDSAALSFAVAFPQAGNGYICTYLFEYAQGVSGPYTAQDAVQLYNQTIFVHEYLHMIFIGRVAAEVEAFHDFVTPLGQYIGQGGFDLCSYDPQTPPGDFGGNLILQLCVQSGFELHDLTASLAELDALVRSGGGQIQTGFQHPVASMAQYRDILNRLLGKDTRQAFADACWPAELFADNYTLSEACLHPTPTVEPTRVQ